MRLTGEGSDRGEAVRDGHVDRDGIGMVEGRW